MKRLLNVILIVLLIITIFLVTLSMTILNNKFIKLDLVIHNYYEEVIYNIDQEIKYDHSIEIDDIKSDINNYVDNYYEDKEYTNKIKTTEERKEEELSKIYNDNIKSIKPFNDVKIIHDIVDIITIVFVVITGIIFVKTKKKHNLNLILIISGVVGVILSGIIFICNNQTNMLYTIAKDCYYIYLGINLFIVLINIYLRTIKKYKIFCK